MKIGIVGAGWAGLAAAWTCAREGHEVILWDMAAQAGGRGRSGIAGPNPVGTRAKGPAKSLNLDCGQHVLIGAYTATLRLMRELQVSEEEALARLPLALVDPNGRGLRLPEWRSASLAFLWGLALHPQWSLREKLQVLKALRAWRGAGFRCQAAATVADLCRSLPPRVMDDWIEPLCVAALNTPASEASGPVFLTVLADGLFAGPGGSDLLIPRRPLHELLPGPVLRALAENRGQWRPRCRVLGIAPRESLGWQVDEERVDRLIIATSNLEAARLIQPWDPAWAATAQALPLEPIVTTWIQCPGARLAAPMVSLCGHGSPHPLGPAQFAFDLGAIGHSEPGVISFVSSAAGAWLDGGGLPALEAAVLDQARSLPGVDNGPDLRVIRSVAERRATLRCTPGLQRPGLRPATAPGGIAVAGDYIAGPYPSTLEGAVRSGVAAAQMITNP